MVLLEGRFTKNQYPLIDTFIPKAAIMELEALLMRCPDWEAERSGKGFDNNGSSPRDIHWALRNTGMAKRPKDPMETKMNHSLGSNW